MNLPELPRSVNGHQATPPHAGGVLLVPPSRTVFPTPQVRVAPATLLYALARHQVGRVRLVRLPQWICLLAALLWASGRLPGGWWVTSLWVATLCALQIALLRLRRRDFVTFTPGELPTVQPRPLDARPKLPIFATGQFSVQGKCQRFTWLPGFYRTFATREHALMCQVEERPPASIGRWPEAERGFWYLFFTPSEIQTVRWGWLAFGRTRLPALAVTYHSSNQPAPSRRAQPAVGEIVYLAFDHEDDGRTILADLLYDLHRDHSPAAAE